MIIIDSYGTIDLSASQNFSIHNQMLKRISIAAEQLESNKSIVKNMEVKVVSVL